MYDNSDEDFLHGFPMKEVFKSFYRVRLKNLGQVSPEINSLSNPDWTEIKPYLTEENLLLVVFQEQQIAYFGIVKDVVGRTSALELPAPFSWDQLMAIGLQMDSAPVKFR